MKKDDIKDIFNVAEESCGVSSGDVPANHLRYFVGGEQVDEAFDESFADNPGLVAAIQAEFNGTKWNSVEEFREVLIGACAVSNSYDSLRGLKPWRLNGDGARMAFPFAAWVSEGSVVNKFGLSSCVQLLEDYIRKAQATANFETEYLDRELKSREQYNLMADRGEVVGLQMG